MRRIIYLLLLLTSAMTLTAQTVVRMDMPPQAGEKLRVIPLFNEKLPEGITVVVGLTGYDIQGGIPPYDFEWVLNGKVVSTDDILIFTPQKGDILSLTVTDRNHCRSSTAFNLKVARISQPAATEEVTDIVIYPTAVTDHVHVEIPDSVEDPALMRIFNLGGKVVFTKEIHGSQTLNLNLPPGIYFISVRTDEEQKVEKIVVK